MFTSALHDVLLAWLAVASLGLGVHIPMQTGRSRFTTRLSTADVSKRAHRPRSPAISTTADLINLYTNNEYVANINIGGQVFMVQIGLSSSDLWVATAASSQYADTGHTADVFYIAEQEGRIKTGELTINQIGLNNQAFIVVDPSVDFIASEGLFGLGPYWNSQTFGTMQNASALPSMDRIFSKVQPSDTYISLYFGRQLSAPTFSPSFSSGGGDFTISELLPQWENITSTPILPVSILNETLRPLQHWQILLDENGVIGPDGQTVTTPTNASANLAPNATNQLAFALEASFALAQVPDYIADAMYASIPGARKEFVPYALGEAYVLPCDAEVNVTFVFGGQKIPIHPLDANMEGYLDINNNSICVGGFQPALPGYQTSTLDGYLSLPFLRNVYTLINYGSFVYGASPSARPPFIQFLPLTDPATTHQEFLDVRVNKSSSGRRTVPTGGLWSGLSLLMIANVFTFAWFI